ncbi:MAG: Ig-like domain-containing protein [Deltaproteobacteria bacterium]|nr:Ig-like domain-containing protein [Deltaproteobacteria bacterium]
MKYHAILVVTLSAFSLAGPITGCSSEKKETAIMLNVKAKMAVPSELDLVELEVYDGRTGDLLGSQQRTPKSSEATNDYRRIWSVAIVAGSPEKYPEGVDIFVKGSHGGQEVSSAGARKTFLIGGIVYQTINLVAGNSAPHIVSTTPKPGETGVDLMVVPTAVFNAPMAQGGSGIAEAFVLEDDKGSVVQGKVSLSQDGQDLAFKPDKPLERNTKYHATIRAGNLDGRPYLVLAKDGKTGLAYSYTWSFDTGDTLAVVSTTPADGQQGVPTNEDVTIEFDRDLDSGSINQDTIKVVAGQTGVSGSVALQGTRKLVFTPESGLVENATHIVTVSSSIKAKDKSTLKDDYVFSFTTKGEAPKIAGTNPEDGDKNVSPSTSITVEFTEPMDKVSVQDALSVNEVGVGEVQGDITYKEDPFTMEFRPKQPLNEGSLVQVTISKAAKDLSGLPLAKDYTFSFTVGTGPAIISTKPGPDEYDVPLDTVIKAAFDRDMNGDTIKDTSFQVTCSDKPVGGLVTYLPQTREASFTPGEDLPENIECTALLTTAVQDSMGIPLLADYSWSFHTRMIPPMVIETDPPNGSMDVPLSTRSITVKFSEKLDKSSVTKSAIRVTDHGMSESATASLQGSGDAVTLTFTKDLAPGRTYFIEVSDEIKDMQGVPLATPYIGIFSTVAKPDILYFSPTPFTSNVPYNKSIEVGFASRMDKNSFQLTKSPDSPKSVTVLKGDGTLVDVSMNYYSSPRNLHIVMPGSGTMDRKQRYTFLLDGRLISDENGERSDIVHSFTFLVGDQKDDNAPRLLGSEPKNNDTQVPLSKTMFLLFSEPIEPITATALNIALRKQGETSQLARTIRYVGNNAVMIVPKSTLEPGTTYHITVGKGVRDLSGNQLENAADISFKTIESDPTPPNLAGTYPPPGSTDLPSNSSVVLFFDKPVVKTSVRISAEAGETKITGSVNTAYYNMMVVFTPDSDWPPGKQVTLFVEPGIRDVDGNQSTDRITATFFTSNGTKDTVAPLISMSTPKNDDRDIPPGTSISLVFNKVLDFTTLHLFDKFDITIRKERTGTKIPCYASFDFDTNKLEIVPQILLEGGEKYIVELPSTVKDLAGNLITVGDGKNRIAFTVDDQKPHVIETVPGDMQDMGPADPIQARFDEDMKSHSLNLLNFFIWKDGDDMSKLIPGAVGYSHDTMLAVLQPAIPLDPGNYNIILKNSVTDLAGNAITANTALGYGWSVTVKSGGLWVTDITPSAGSVLGPDDMDQSIKVRFNKDLNTTTIQNNFKVINANSVKVPGTTTYSDRDYSIVFIPDSGWEYEQTYRVSIGTGLEASDGDKLDVSFNSSFKTVKILFQDDMEGDTNDWSQSGRRTDLNTWKIKEDDLGGGNGDNNNVWAVEPNTLGGNDYIRPCLPSGAPDESISLYSPSFQVPLEINTVFLRFDHKFEINQVDSAEVQAIKKGGTQIPITLVQPFNGKSNGYTNVEVQVDNVGGVSGSDFELSLRFKFNIDGQRTSSCDPTGFGWRVDNVMVYGY